MFERLRPLAPYLSRYWKNLAWGGVAVILYNVIKVLIPLVIGHAIDAVIKHGAKAVALTPFAPGECIAGERLASPRVETKRAPASKLRKQVMSAEQEARARLALRARDRRSMSLPKLAAYVRGQLGEADSVSSADLQVDSIESVRALQVLCTVSAANAAGTKLLRANARAMSSGFTTVRMEGEEEAEEVADKGISHLPFTIARTTKATKGGSQ